MNITYIGHSGFLVELDDCYFLFDYYQGDLPELLPNKLVIVFASHSHPDHFNPKIFELLKGQEQIYAVLSKDIFTSRVPKEIDSLFVKAGMEYNLPHDVRLQTLQSTDIGVAFVLFKNETIIYHAGDLNDWVWREETVQNNKSMTGRYRKEIDSLRGMTIDAAFVPLDSRQEENYANGMLYFLKTVHAKKVFPMHFWNKPEIIEHFLHDNSSYKNTIVSLTRNGESVEI